MTVESGKQSLRWMGGVEVIAAASAKRNGQPALYRDRSFLTGTLWALDEHGVRAGRLTFNVLEDDRLVLLGNASMDKSEGEDGKDDRGKGGGRALMEKLENLYPAPDWWFAADPLDLHNAEGLALMRSRRGHGRQWVHTEDCQDRKPTDCTCEFPEWPSDAATP